MKTFNNQRGVLGAFFKFCFHRGWVTENSVLKVPHYRIRQRRGMARTLSATQAQELMEYFETFEGGRWVPYFALCLFVGIRPGVPDCEITKLKPDDVNLETGLIHTSADVSKVREPLTRGCHAFSRALRSGGVIGATVSRRDRTPRLLSYLNKERAADLRPPLPRFLARATGLCCCAPGKFLS